MDRAIPPIFHSFDTKSPFNKCIECERALDEDCHYVIEKAIRKYEGFAAEDVIFDYAICVDCAMEIRNSFSASSKAKMDEYFLENASRIRSIAEGDTGLQACLLSGKKAEELKEYQIYAPCVGQKLNGQIQPYLISSEAQDEIMNLISNETLDILNGFFDKHFSPDPELIKPIPVLI